MSNIPIKVNDLISDRLDALCDRCIQEILGLRQANQVQQTTSALATTREFCREKGLCGGCRKIKMVTRRQAAA